MDAIEALRSALNNGTIPLHQIEKPVCNCSFEYAVWRFLHAWQNGAATPDLIVLLRQVARWGGEIFVGGLPFHFEPLLWRAGISLSGAGFLSATPFVPHWLKGDAIDTRQGIDPKPTLRRCSEDIPGEPYLKSLNYTNWYSQAQKEAVWTAITAPPRSTTLIALPTGTGKSLCFQILSRFGTGLTVVVVPTVALAIDQWDSARKVLDNIPGLNPLYYASSDPNLDRESVLDAIKNGTCRLIFTSPEACVSGHLRNRLEDAVSQGRLENLVIDEAHIIETWGIYFRVDFQMLSVLRRKWMKSENTTLRTYLLSATFTPHCREVLLGLYGGDGEWREFISQRLRPEITYYARDFKYFSEREQAVLDCVWNLPRPTIIYTTEVKEAERLNSLLRSDEHGFSRTGCFHGETKSDRRREMLDKWRNHAIDLMVATSAFGLGVDKPDVRSVVHVCLPENLHRFYQEVGRGGRDGFSTTSILIPCERDKRVARNITPKLLKEETIQKRWKALFSTASWLSREEHILELPTNSKHTGLLGMRTWSENIRWNKRLLLQLMRSDQIDLLDLDYRHGESGDGEPVEWVKARIKFNPISGRVGELLTEQRERELKSLYAGFDQMEEALKGNACIGRLLARLYGSGTIAVCGGCPKCRSGGVRFRGCPKLLIDASPAPAIPAIKIVADCPTPFTETERPAFVRLLRRSVKEKEISRFLCWPSDFEDMLKIFGAAFDSSDLSIYRLDSTGWGEININPEERLAILHGASINRPTLAIRCGSEVVHLFSRGADILDADRRYPLESEGVRLRDCDTWLKED